MSTIEKLYNYLDQESGYYIMQGDMNLQLRYTIFVKRW